jgi:hypothetical protein
MFTKRDPMSIKETKEQFKLEPNAIYFKLRKQTRDFYKADPKMLQDLAERDLEFIGHEVIIGQSKIYLDIEKCYEEEPVISMSRAIYDKHASLLREVIVSEFDTDDLPLLISACSANGYDEEKKAYKVSYHIIANVMLESSAHVRHFLETHYLPKLTEEEREFVDMKVYSAGNGEGARFMRMPRAHTDAKKRPLKLFTGSQFLDCLITYKGGNVGIYDYDLPVQEVKKKVIDDSTEKPTEQVNPEELTEYLMMLDTVYYTDYELWIKVLWAMRSTGLQTKAYKIFKAFSKQCKEKYNPNAILEEWGRSTDCGNPVTWRSIPVWASKCDLARYTEIHNRYNIAKKKESSLSFATPIKDFFWPQFLEKWSGNDYTDELLADLCKVVALLPDGYGKYLVRYDGEQKNIVYRAKKLFEESVNNYFVYKNDNGNRKAISMTNIIRQYPIKLQINKVIFNPDPQYEIKHRVFNMFEGFNATIQDTYNIDKLQCTLGHIEKVLAKNDPKVFKYIMGWLASVIQKPHIKNGTALVFISEQGSGKGIFGEYLVEKIIGKEYAWLCNDIGYFVAKFNSITALKMLTVLDELTSIGGTSRDFHATFDKMKALITNKTTVIERKGIDSLMVDDFNNLILFSNNENCVKVENSDRRYMITRTNEEFVGNRRYFTDLAEELEDNADDFYTYLMQYDLFDFEIRDIPMTDTKDKQIHLSLSPLVKFVIESINNDSFKDKVGATEFAECYDQYARDNGLCSHTMKMKRGNTYSDTLLKLEIEKKKQTSGWFLMWNVQKIKENLLRHYKVTCEGYLKYCHSA